MSGLKNIEMIEPKDRPTIIKNAVFLLLANRMVRIFEKETSPIKKPTTRQAYTPKTAGFEEI